MGYRNLREYLELLRKRELLCIIDDLVCKDTELVPLVRLQFRGLPEMERRAFWFKNVTDVRQRKFESSVVIGSLGCSREVYGAALGVGPDDIGTKWGSVQGKPIKPVNRMVVFLSLRNHTSGRTILSSVQ